MSEPDVAPRWSNRSIRFRITAVATVLVIVVLTITMASLALLQRRSLDENLRDAIGQRADDLTDLLAGGATDVLVASGGEDTLAQVVQAGQVLVAAPSIRGAAPITDDPVGTNDSWQRVDRLVAGGEAHLVLSRLVDTPQGVVTLHVAGSLGDLEEATAALVKALLILVPLAALLLACITSWLVGKTLSPVESIRAEVDEIGGRVLHRRVPQPGGGDEISRLAATMNRMLDRVERSHLAQDRFVADASHELRTPLTRMRTELDVALAELGHDPARPADAAVYRSALDETIRMQHLVDDLLLLARSDGDGLGSPDHSVRVDLDDIVFAEADRLRALGRRVIDVSAVGAAQVIGDPHRLRRAIANLADNAERHALSTVRLRLCEADGRAELAVEDDGLGVQIGADELIFERFGRADEARSAGVGAGLGLAIARDIVVRNGGTLNLDRHHRPGARFVVSLPLAQ